MTPAFAALAMLVAFAGSAEAASRLCRQLEAQLSAGSRGGGAQARKYAAAAQTQRRHLARARAQQRQAGCGFFGGGRGCGALNATVARMERNLAGLESRSGRGGSRAGRTRILAALDANGCRERRQRERPRIAETRRIPQAPPRLAESRDQGDRTFLQQLFGADERPSREADDQRKVRSAVNRSDRRIAAPSGSVRTMCVRTCDGYFFPMSSGSSSDVFDRDQKACEIMCPGTEMALYVHRAPDEESEAMVSVAGTPYTELPTAFAYKAANFVRPEGCGCNARKNFTIIAGEPKPDGDPAAVEEAALPVPSGRPDPASDPETLANSESGLDAATIARMLTSKPAAGAEGGEKRVRVVGPVFLPDPEGAIDLRAPVQSQVQ